MDLQAKGKEMETNDETKVTIVDVKIPFISMVMLLVKTAIASIPALIILAVLGAIVVAVLGGIGNMYGIFDPT